MPIPWIGLGAGGALGLLKGLLGRGEESRDRLLQANLARVSPWSGIAPREVKRANIGGDIASGAIGGAEMEKGIRWMDKFKDAELSVEEPKSPEEKKPDVTKDDKKATRGLAGKFDDPEQQVYEDGIRGLPAMSPWYGMRRTGATY